MWPHTNLRVVFFRFEKISIFFEHFHFSDEDFWSKRIMWNSTHHIELKHCVREPPACPWRRQYVKSRHFLWGKGYIFSKFEPIAFTSQTHTLSIQPTLSCLVLDRFFWIGSAFFWRGIRRVVEKGSGRMHWGKRFVVTVLARDFYHTHKVQVLENISHIMKYHNFEQYCNIYLCVVTLEFNILVISNLGCLFMHVICDEVEIFIANFLQFCFESI